MKAYLENLNCFRQQFRVYTDWIQGGRYLPEKYTPQGCHAVSQVFDNLIDHLLKIGKDAPEQQKLESFRQAVSALNILNERYDLIESGEIRELHDLLKELATKAGLDDHSYLRLTVEAA